MEDTMIQLHTDICTIAEIFLSSALSVATSYQFRDLIKQDNIVNSRLFEDISSQITKSVPATEELIEHICFVYSDLIKQAVLLDARHFQSEKK